MYNAQLVAGICRVKAGIRPILRSPALIFSDRVTICPLISFSFLNSMHHDSTLILLSTFLNGKFAKYPYSFLFFLQKEKQNILPSNFFTKNILLSPINLIFTSLPLLVFLPLTCIFFLYMKKIIIFDIRYLNKFRNYLSSSRIK